MIASNKMEQELIEKWKAQYIGDPQNILTITFAGYKELAITNGFRMGRINMQWGKDRKGNLVFMYGTIYLDDDHTKCPTYFTKAVLWHEFCHAWDAFTKIHVDHCSKFQRKKWKKPKYAIADALLKIIGWIWFD